MYLLLGLTVHTLVALASRNERSRSCALNALKGDFDFAPAAAPAVHHGKSGEAEKSAFVQLAPAAAPAVHHDEGEKGGDTIVVVQLADPQLGMLNQFASGDLQNDFTEEASMAGQLVEMATKLDPQPTFLVLGGDMQNQWPNQDADEGKRERHAVENFLAPITNLNIPVVCTPGNHDLGDHPSAEDLSKYKVWWKNTCYNEVKLTDYSYEKAPDGVSETWRIGKYLFLQIDSQLYYDNTEDANVRAARDRQTAWINETTSNIGETQYIVIFTHIPPFMNSPDEAHGWANWNTEDRRQVLSILEKAASHPPSPRPNTWSPPPIMWVCGHFHTNVFNIYELPKSEEKIVHVIQVTSAAGTTMYWGESQGTMTSQQAAAVAGKPIGQAFCEDICRGAWSGAGCDPKFCPDAKNERMKPIEDRSGMHIFVFNSMGKMIQKWFTLKDLKSLVKQDTGKIPLPG